LSPPSHDVVVTGYGVVSPLGAGVSALWDGLCAGRSAVAPIARFAADDLTPRRAAEVRDVASDDPDRAAAFAVHAARDALADAGLDPAAVPRLGVALGTTLGGMRLFERWTAGEGDEGLRGIPYFAPAARVARTIGCTGPVATTQLACASGTQAIALGAAWVRRGQADVVLAGGADLLCRFVVAGFNALRATADVARPFDVARRGLVLGEGAAVLVLESAAHARARGARARARLVGAGAAGDATHMTAPDRDGGGAARAMAAALRDAGIAPAAVGFVSAHGTGTAYNDAMEAVAIARVFGPRAVPVNSIKGAVGHTLGAAGALEAVVCAEVLQRGVVPPTAGLVTLDPACAGLDVVAGAPRPVDVGVAVSTSSGFAGANAALVLARA
jgi:3-oxoacyl-(acyl-carrier-protein) synthase